MSEEKSYARKTPCSECPFARSTPPGATGGSDSAIYVGQAHGPFFLPCHMDPDYEKDRYSLKLMQCAGAAIYRANTGRAALMHKSIHALPADKEKVFASPEELVAHHGQMSLEAAKMCLALTTPDMLMDMCFRQAGVRVLVK